MTQGYPSIFGKTMPLCAKFFRYTHGKHTDTCDYSHMCVKFKLSYTTIIDGLWQISHDALHDNSFIMNVSDVATH